MAGPAVPGPGCCDGASAGADSAALAARPREGAGAAIEGASWEPYRRSPAGAAFDPFESKAVAAVIFDELESELHRSVDYVVLFRFKNARNLEGYWMWRADAASSAAPMRQAPCVDGRPGLDTWLHGEYLCYVSDAGNALLRWTDERTDTFGVMNAAPGRTNLKQLYRYWEEIGGATED